MKFKLLTMAALFAAMSAGISYAGVDATSASWTLYKVNLYESGDCTGTPQTVLDSATGVTGNFVANPTLGTSSVADGTYNCVAVKMSDTVTFTPAANEGSSCVAGTSYSMNVCQSVFTTTDAETSAQTSCTNGEDTVWIYISTYSSSTTGSQSNNAFAPPTSNPDATNGIKLANPLVVSGATTGTFVINTSGKVATLTTGDQGAERCDMDQPSFSFQ